MVNGESALYLGRQYQIEVIQNSSEEIRFEQRFLIPARLSSERKKVLRNWYMERANEKILPRTKKFANDLGVEFANVKIVDNRYRWGSCTTKDNINFNWRLIKAPMYVVDYVDDNPMTLLGLKKPVEPALPILGEPQEKFVSFLIFIKRSCAR